MTVAYKEHIQFILLLVVMYVMGVWIDPTIYIVFPLVILMLGVKERFFEMLICAIWMLILADYIPVSNATYADLQFAKDLKPLIPIALFAFMMLHRERFSPFPKFIFYFIPFFVIAAIGLTDSIDFGVGFRKTISFTLMYITIPAYVNLLHREWGEFFWISLFTYIIGMLTIGVILGFAIPDIGILEHTTRFKGIFGNPNGTGIFLNLTLMLFVVLSEFKMIRLTKRERLYTIAIIAISILWCGSRNAVMSAMLFLLVYQLVKVNWFLGVVGVVAFVSFSEFIFEGLINIVSFFGMEEFFRVETVEKGSGRTIAWAFAWSEIQNYFFVGGGFGHDEHIMRPNYKWLVLKGHDGGVHNSYLSMWFDTGIIGVILYYGTLLIVIFKSFRYHTIVMAFAVSLFFNVTYESWLVASLNPFTIILLIILTIFAQNFRGAAHYAEVEQIEEQEEPEDYQLANA